MMKSPRLISFAIFLIVTLSVTTAKNLNNLHSGRIVNGLNAKEGQFPHMVSLRDTLEHSHGCGASILTSRFLLTAAHCCNGRSPSNMYAVVGSYRISSGGVKYELDTVTPHDEFSMFTGKYDVALLRTAKEITFTDLIQPVALPTSNLPDDKSVQLVLAGWGRDHFPLPTTPDVLQYSEMKTISINECSKRFGNIPILQRMLHEGNVCTLDKEHASGACHGDSGSGLIDMNDPKHRTIVGIASWVYPCAQGYPDAYTRVWTHLDWIHEQIEIQSRYL